MWGQNPDQRLRNEWLEDELASTMLTASWVDHSDPLLPPTATSATRGRRPTSFLTPLIYLPSSKIRLLTPTGEVLKYKSSSLLHSSDDNTQFVSLFFAAFASQLLVRGPTPRRGNKTDSAHPPIHPTKYSSNLQVGAFRSFLVARFVHVPKLAHFGNHFLSVN